MKSPKSIISLIVVACLLALPMTAFARKGKDHFKQGLKYEQQQQWEQAAQEFTLAMAADPSNADFQLHYRRAVFNASQMFMQKGRALAEQRDYVGAYNAFRQAFGYDPVNQLAVSEMERMLRLQEVKQGGPAPQPSGDGSKSEGTGGTPASPTNAKPAEDIIPPQPEQVRVVNYNGDLKHYIRTLAEQLGLNVIFDKQTFAQPRTLEINLTQPTTTAKALDFIFLQESLFFQKLDRHTILVADQARRPQYQQLVVRTFYLSNAKPSKALEVITKALPASVGRPQSIVVVDEDTNSLTVRDTAENVKLIGELLTSIDKDRAEVVMDVDIYEVSRTNLLQFGNQLGSGTFNLGGSPGLAVLSNNGVTNGSKPGINLGNIVGTTPTGFATALVIPASVLTAFQSKTNAKLLASTQVHAFNNEESTARIGQRVPIQTASVFNGFSTTPTTGTAPGVTNGVFGSNGFPVINYEPTGLTLSFTPQVFPNLDVQVKMKIESKDVSGANTLTPTFTERTISGTARVQNNRTMMLASVSQDIQSTGRSGLPILSGLPLVGRLFTSPTRDNRQVDIVIAVTPRVLRAPAVTPRDEEMRPSGTLQSPTTGSLEAMLRENYREDQLAAARKIPRDATVQLPDAPAYVPAAAAQTSDQPASNGTSTQSAPAQGATVAKNDAASQAPPVVSPTAVNNTAGSSTTPADSAMPQPKAASLTAQGNSGAANKLDVATAIKNVVTPSTSVTKTSDDVKQDKTVSAPVEDLAPKSEATANAGTSKEPLPTIIELRTNPAKTEMAVGEKRQLAVELNSDAPLGLTVISLRFDPNVIKVNSITPGTIFASASPQPTITQLSNEKGVLLVSITPAAGSQISGEGALLNLEVEAIGKGDSSLSFDLSNLHLVASDGRATVLQLTPMTLVVKPATAISEAKPIPEKQN
jgi:general secretion pathway protein D